MSEEERRGIQQTLRGGQDGIDDGLTPAERRAQLTAHQRELRTDYRAIIEESAGESVVVISLAFSFVPLSLMRIRMPCSSQPEEHRHPHIR
jgi:hypothetical protein